MSLADDLDMLINSDFQLRMGRAELVPSRSQLALVGAELLEQFNEYIGEVSEAEHAMSLQTASYLLFLCRALDAHRVLDLGSGFSSYVLRHYAETATHPVVTCSVDTDPVWAQRTVTFCNAHGVAAYVESWADFIDIDVEPFDVVFHDLAGGMLRNEAMPFACSLVAPTGVIVFDDSHHDGHRAAAQSICAADALEWFSLHRQTSDRFSRFASMGVRS